MSYRNQRRRGDAKLYREDADRKPWGKDRWFRFLPTHLAFNKQGQPYCKLHPGARIVETHDRIVHGQRSPFFRPFLDLDSRWLGSGRRYCSACATASDRVRAA